ncbi:MULTISPECIES: hypothetical protein [unclassified Leisingera]|uniref:hypothetical protein n=1 Tax=unclassified Leisingera TaxID=2614906 RepID=UPI0010116F5E|nr:MULTISPECIES: hypothetical protein [unclassified Leisingera]MCF6433156.1 hypothetical protein [Leisingera sp. MMG026]QAX32387.1 hypothetical protein ETW24_23665 [Leisingera sp. NJS204]
MTWLRVKLAARAISRMGGGTRFFWGGFVGHHRIMMLMSAIIVFYMTVVLIADFPEMRACLETNQPSHCIMPMYEAIILDASGIIIFLAVLGFALGVALECVIKPIAKTVTISQELEALAAEGVPEAAQALAELHDERGADAHAFLWRQKAADLGHPTAIKQLKGVEG